jgi:tetraacyldisaccharide 4'-kinase
MRAEDGRAGGTLWTSNRIAARVARGLAMPLSGAYGAAIAVRDAMYDRELLPIREAGIPVIAVGNLTVGGTGKTPLAAWTAAALETRGARPAIVLRGYRGGDETAVHRILNPSVPAVARVDRAAGIVEARALGCDVVVLDDGFQHRQLHRAMDFVLLSADAWAYGTARHLLPAGPWREPLAALRRASVVIVTRKAATDPTVASLRAAIAGAAPAVPIAVARIALGDLRTLAGDRCALEDFRDAPIFAVAGIGDPRAFFAQLRTVTTRLATAAFPDHHHYTGRDVARLDRDLARCAEPGTSVVCTLKDAVKLAVVWPRAAGGAALWYVSQRVEFEQGVEAVTAALDAIVRMRPVP